DLVFEVRPADGGMIVKNMSSVIYRRDSILTLGGWNDVRFGADSELVERHAIKFGKVARVFDNLPLVFILTRHDSLTTNGPTGLNSLQFGARREYKASYRYWHRKQTQTGAPDLSCSPANLPFPVPAITRSRERKTLEFDILHVGCSTRSNIGAMVTAWREG